MNSKEDLLALIDDQLDFLKSLHLGGSLAPLAAAMDLNGKISGVAFTSKDPAVNSISVEGAIRSFQEKFRSDASKGELLACAIFYHGCHGPDEVSLNVAPAQQISDADCIVALLDHRVGQAIACVIRYSLGADDGWRYAPAYYAPKQPDIFVESNSRPQSTERDVRPD